MPQRRFPPVAYTQFAKVVDTLGLSLQTHGELISTARFPVVVFFLIVQLGVNRHQEKTVAARSRVAALEEKHAIFDPALVC